MPEIRNWKWEPREEGEGKAGGDSNGGLGSNSKAVEPHIMRKAS